MLILLQNALGFYFFRSPMHYCGPTKILFHLKNTSVEILELDVKNKYNCKIKYTNIVTFNFKGTQFVIQSLSPNSLNNFGFTHLQCNITDVIYIYVYAVVYGYIVFLLQYFFPFQNACVFLKRKQKCFSWLMFIFLHFIKKSRR